MMHHLRDYHPYGLSPATCDLHQSNIDKFAFILNVWYNVGDAKKYLAGNR